MRFLLSLCIWILFVGGLWLYTWQRDAGLPDGPPEAAAAVYLEGDYQLEITPTFSIENDPFALASDTGKTAPVELRLNGKKLEFPFAEMTRGKVIKIQALPELLAGFNEFYISASPPVSETGMDHGMRLRFLNGGTVLADETIWASHGALVSGTVSFTLSPEKDPDHGH